MIVGHLGVAAVLAAARPRASLWWLLPAAIAPDLLDIAYAIAGVCNPYGLYSHTLPAALLLGTAIAGAAVLAGRRETAAVALLVVLLHLPMDYLTGWKLYWPGGEVHGLRLYDHPVADFLAEGLLVAAGWAALRGRATVPRWATAAGTLAALLLLQGSAIALRGRLDKPSACLAVETGPPVP